MPSVVLMTSLSLLKWIGLDVHVVCPGPNVIQIRLPQLGKLHVREQVSVLVVGGAATLVFSGRNIMKF
jgi:hypothetical protein